MSLVPLLRLIREQLPGVPLYLSTSTAAGREAASRQASSLVNGVFYLPFDFGFAMRRIFRWLRPRLLIVVETEIWPNLFALAHYSGASLAVINGRISDRSWPTYRRWQSLFAAVLGLPDLIQVQSRTDVERYAQLGAPASVLLTDANLKYDAALTGRPLHFPTFDAGQIWIAASTVGPNERGSLTAHSIDEDDIVLSVFEQLATQFPRLLLILAPRQPARFDEVAAKLASRQLNSARRSSNPDSLSLPGVLLLDTMGELASIYPLANVVFVGGSLAPRGGHNIIEPAAAGVPVVVGPHMQNFEAIARNFLDDKAMVQLKNADALAPAVRSFLQDPVRRQQLGQRARNVVNRQRGIAQRTLDRLAPLYFTGSFQPPKALPVQMLLNRLAGLWEIGSRWKRRGAERLAAQRSPLPVPVISIGALSVGGTGKTPFTIALAQLLQECGAHPAILTRGYGRQSTSIVVAGPGATLPVEETGDEAHIFLRTHLVPVGIGADRYQAARMLLEQFPQTDILLLDDGFQHARIPREIDIVLIDALNPFSNRRVLPAGRLREPITALARAHIVAITRCESDRAYSALAEHIGHANPNLDIFRADTTVSGWREAKSGTEVSLDSSRRAFAFCGLGNPQSFWNTLNTLAVHVVSRRTFADHHRYSSADMECLEAEAAALGADMLLTTEKDRFNLPPDLPPIEILYLPIETKIRDSERLLQLVKRVSLPASSLP